MAEHGRIPRDGVIMDKGLLELRGRRRRAERFPGGARRSFRGWR
ncbi:hypothetical protein STXM2123_3635 [Streptomyces sp. F-3]|nr:hypothetical protein STXM2123_3635 [Streptomyces sp. F-3]